MAKRWIDAYELKQLILAERDRIPLTLPSAIYEFGIPKPNHHGNAMRGGIRKALRCLEQCKTVDAVEVVRCKDCRQWSTTDKGLRWCSHAMMGRCTSPNDFCSYGERRTDV